VTTLGMSQGNELKSDMIYLASITSTEMVTYLADAVRPSVDDWPISGKRNQIRQSKPRPRCALPGGSSVAGRE